MKLDTGNNIRFGDIIESHVNRDNLLIVTLE